MNDETFVLIFNICWTYFIDLEVNQIQIYKIDPENRSTGRFISIRGAITSYVDKKRIPLWLINSRGGSPFGGLYADEFQRGTPFWGAVCMLMNFRGGPHFGGLYVDEI